MKEEYSLDNLFNNFRLKRLLIDKDFIETKIKENTKEENKEQSFKGFFKDVKKSFCMNVGDYNSKKETNLTSINKLKESLKVELNEEELKLGIKEYFEDENINLKKLYFVTLLSLDEEYSYYEEELGLKECSKLLFDNNENKLSELNDKFKKNYRSLYKSGLLNDEKIKVIDKKYIEEELNINNFKDLAPNEEAYLLALKLTLIESLNEENKDLGNEETKKMVTLLNERLVNINNLLFIDKVDVNVNSKRLDVLNNLESRLKEILNIE